MLLSLKNNYKKQLPLLLTAVLIVGLVYSRALLSIASIGLGIVAIINYAELKKYKTIFIAIACILLPVIISGIWSENKEAWWRSIEVKLSFFTIVLGIVSAKFSLQQLKKLVWLLTVVVVSSALYSCYEYLINKELVLKNYLVAKVMPVLMDDDHIRYSWLIVLNIIVLTWIVFLPRRHKENKVTLEQWMAAFSILFLTAYLHFLAAKTGLLCLYTSIGIMILYTFLKSKWWIGLLLIVAIAMVGFLAYKNLPSLKNRVQYVLYDFSNYSKGIYTEGSSDGARVLSLKAGFDITKQHLLTGVGFGDIQTEIIKWHNIQHPSSKAYERFLPTNQWLIYGAGSGFLGVIFFSIGLFLLLKEVTAKSIFSIITIAVLLLPLITDDSFEGQHGISIFSLILVFLLAIKRVSITPKHLQ
jgi:O-antigen ligase